ncbi:hypothetical protein SUGI_0942070 [Cryptomeria japonica]|nr:hypothetical protein SUGI_0942070 [Cryptomeria japonica]
MVHHFGVSFLCREESIQAQCSQLFQANDVLWNVVWQVANGLLGGNQHWCDGFVYEAVICPMVDIFDSKEATIQRIDEFVCPSNGPNAAILILKQPLHVDKNGEACHGVDDTNNELRSQFAPNLANECKAYIERLLLMAVSVDAIVDRHLDDLVFHDMLKKRDSFMTCKDVINVATRVRSIRSQNHVHDATSILE